MHMQRRTLTLKTISKATEPQLESMESDYVQAGRKPKMEAVKANTALLNKLSELIEYRCKVFIQMRHGVGYCGLPVQIDDGWLAMDEVSVHGTKKTVSAKTILIQINDGSFIAHVHPTDPNQIGVTK